MMVQFRDQSKGGNFFGKIDIHSGPVVWNVYVFWERLEKVQK